MTETDLCIITYLGAPSQTPQTAKEIAHAIDIKQRMNIEDAKRFPKPAT